MGSPKVAAQRNVSTKATQMASIGAIFTSSYHTKQLNPWQNSSASRMVNYSWLSGCQRDVTKQLNPWQNSSAGRVVNYSWLSGCQRDVEPFEGDPSTCGCRTGLRNKP